MTSLAEDYRKEQARNRELLTQYRALPNNVGAFGALMIEDLLRRADEAVMNGDVVAMLRCYAEMKESK